MPRRIVVLLVLMMLILVPALNAASETAAADTPFDFNGASWGLTKAEIRSLNDTEPFQEPTAQTGHSALVYQVQMNDLPCIIQYNFLPGDDLYNITVMAPDSERTFYKMIENLYASLYGNPLTAEDASLKSEDPTAVMMAGLMQNSDDTDYLGWNADKETVIILSFEPTYSVCYVEIRRWTDYFYFSSDPE